MSELSILELATEHGELLPERETMFLNFGGGNHASVGITSVAVAKTYGGFGNLAAAANSNTVVIVQG